MPTFELDRDDETPTLEFYNRSTNTEVGTGYAAVNEGNYYYTVDTNTDLDAETDWLRVVIIVSTGTIIGYYFPEAGGTGEILDRVPEEPDTTLLLKLLRNKQITDPDTGVLTVYDDDGSTPLLTADIFEDADGATPYRGQGIERRERLE